MIALGSISVLSAPTLPTHPNGSTSNTHETPSPPPQAPPHNTNPHYSPTLRRPPASGRVGRPSHRFSPYPQIFHVDPVEPVSRPQQPQNPHNPFAVPPDRPWLRLDTMVQDRTLRSPSPPRPRTPDTVPPTPSLGSPSGYSESIASDSEPGTPESPMTPPLVRIAQ
jgi:hypothetical protein